MPNKNTKEGGAVDQRFDADATLYKPKMDLPRCMVMARKRHGKSVASQIKEVLTRSRGCGCRRL